MEEQYIENSVKKRLILAGLRELEEHGVRDFSLRRVALAAQVSCAAPYRHFKDKEALILGVISYVADDFELLARQISEVFAEDYAARLTQLASASFRFWLANSNFRMVMLAGADSADSPLSREMARFDSPVASAVSAVAGDRAEEAVFSALSLIYGAVDLATSGRFSAESALACLQGELGRLITSLC